MSPFNLFSQDVQNEMQHYLIGHELPIALSIAPLHLFSYDNHNEVQQNVWPCNANDAAVKCHIVPTVSSMVPLLGTVDQKEMHHDFLNM